MALLRTKRCRIALAAASVVLLWVYSFGKSAPLSVRTFLHSALHLTETRSELMSVLRSTSPNVVHPGSFRSYNDRFSCKKAVLMNMTFPVCHYTVAIDDTVTGLLMRGKYYEADEVSRFVRLLRSDQRLQLVDIGANVGLWSLPAARITQVLAVEPNWRSMSRLAKAVDLGAVGSNITLIHNAVSDVRGTFHLGVHARNQGNTFVINTTKCIQTPVNQPCNTVSSIGTIFLNDLVPLMRSKSALLKVDVEGHEFKVFTNSSAGKFFDQIDVPLVFMEWVLCKRYSTETMQRLLYFFYSRNYTAYNVDVENSKLDNRYLNWPYNVLFKKSTSIRF